MKPIVYSPEMPTVVPPGTFDVALNHPDEFAVLALVVGYNRAQETNEADARVAAIQAYAASVESPTRRPFVITSDEAQYAKDHLLDDTDGEPLVSSRHAKRLMLQLTGALCLGEAWADSVPEGRTGKELLGRHNVEVHHPYQRSAHLAAATILDVLVRAKGRSSN